MRRLIFWTVTLLGALQSLGDAQTLTPSAQMSPLGTTVTIRYEGVTQDLGSPYIVLVGADARDDQDGSVHLTYLSGAPEGEVSFRGVKPGSYQARLYYASAVTGVIARALVRVQSPAAPTSTGKPAPAKPVTPTIPSPAKPTKPQLATLLGGWQCMTRQQASYERMFTFKLNSGTTWTNLTSGAATTSGASYDVKSGMLRLSTAKGTRLYDFDYFPAGGGQKERLVERVLQKDLYQAQVCYRHQ